MELLLTIVLGTFAAAFVIGCLFTLISGSFRGIRILLIILSVLFVLVVIPGFVVTRGWLIFLFFQLMTFWIVIYMFLLTGAAAGFGVYKLIHKTAPGSAIDETELNNYLGLIEFSTREGISEERALSRIKNGFYRGGQFQGNWFVHQSELSGNGSENQQP